MNQHPIMQSQLPIRVCTSLEMKEFDDLAQDRYSLSIEVLMENAGRAATHILMEHFPEAGMKEEILLFAGKGRNAGDAFVVARRLICLGRKARVFHLAPRETMKGIELKNFEILEKLGARLTHLESGSELKEYVNNVQRIGLAIDGLFGIGLKGPLEGIYYDVVEIMNQYADRIVSLDLPSGVHCDTGAVHGTCVDADLTISFGFPKLGHFLPPGAGYRGRLVNVDISYPPQFRSKGKLYLLQERVLSEKLNRRNSYAHKNDFGHVCLVGGSPEMMGAIIMASKACLKTGTGLVTVATWEDTLGALRTRLPDEVMTAAIQLNDSSLNFYKERLDRFSSFILGPGLGKRPEGRQLVELVLNHFEGPLVLDADALNIVSEYQMHQLIARRKGPTVLTPHPGEMARLIGVSKEEVLKDQLKSVETAVEKTQATVVLKGAATFIAVPDETICLNHFPNEGMATAGAGDVLAGVIGGLLGQSSFTPEEATQLGVFLHSKAGDLASVSYGRRSMSASDIITALPQAFTELKELKKQPPPAERGRVTIR